MEMSGFPIELMGGKVNAENTRLYAVVLGDDSYVVRAARAQSAVHAVCVMLKSRMVCRVAKPEDAYRLAQEGAPLLDARARTWPDVDDRTLPQRQGPGGDLL